MKTKEDEMKVSKKYVEKVAEAIAGMVMPEKKSNGVTRKEQVALGAGIATGILFVTQGIAENAEDAGDSPREAAARILCSALSALPEHREALLSKLSNQLEDGTEIVVAVTRN